MALDAVINGNRIANNFREEDTNQLQMTLSGVVGRRELVPAQTGKQIHIIQFVYYTDTALLLILESRAIGIAYTTIANLPFTANGGLFRQSSNIRHPLFSTSAGEGFSVNQSVAAGASYIYIQWRYNG